MIEQDPFRRNAYKLISKMTKLIDEDPDDTTHLLDEVCLRTLFEMYGLNA